MQEFAISASGACGAGYQEESRPLAPQTCLCCSQAVVETKHNTQPAFQEQVPPDMDANCRPLFSIIITETKHKKLVRYLKNDSSVAGFWHVLTAEVLQLLLKEGPDEKKGNNRRDHREQTVDQIKLNSAAI